MGEALLNKGLAALGITVSPQQEEALLLYLRELLRWNKRVNLTSITDEDQAVEKHLVDSLTLLPYLEGVHSLLDIGSGGGFPSLPVKIARPNLEVVSVDAVRKKILFQRHIARLLGLKSFTAVHARVEDLAGQREMDRRFSMITSRALSDLETFVDWARPFAGPGSVLVAMKGRGAEQELEAARRSLEEQGVRLRDVDRIELPFSASRRSLLFFEIA
ncbi:MAG: 16S rRNA (guanine(527)-N(7))-methyltransferase RsmG [Desulfuromonadales bacterium]|nr:16S rRNA (guanine(527)-N(7))-methyltransferase RsmG [Desulfuromonadales bacterium]NIR34404.1 16S rRNA (guanine(527)-N(7))-methyltransferase RsmG [Desulfuromonadales bacterium]NIS40437.1 16S rRNA (guanine(527)-N(7))-methyltransferase RsmG [Desulfuromonadales bacterium]